MTRVKPLFWYTGGKAKLFTIYYPFFQGLHPEHCMDYFGGSGTMSLWGRFYVLGEACTCI